MNMVVKSKDKSNKKQQDNLYLGLVKLMGHLGFHNDDLELGFDLVCGDLVIPEKTDLLAVIKDEGGQLGFDGFKEVGLDLFALDDFLEEEMAELGEEECMEILIAYVEKWREKDGDDESLMLIGDDL